MKVLIAGGGTAGHVNPALALAAEMGNDEVVFLGTERGVEARMVPAAGYELAMVEVRGFDRAKPWSLPATGWKAFGAVRAARKVIRSIDPAVVVGMGGYVSLPACIAARTSGRPVVLHEQNIVLGLSNKVCRPLARRVALSFEATVAEVGDKGVFTGNPVVPSLVALDVKEARARAYETFDLDPGRATLLVFGGSLGAQRLNRAAAGLATRWSRQGDRQILHITGASQHEEVLAAVAGAEHRDLLYRVLPYVEDMGAAYAVADLALCRGGATTVAELGVIGVPAIVVPYPHHRDRQQERHGRVLEEAGAAEVMLDAQATSDAVADRAAALLSDSPKLEAMRAAALRLGRPDAASRLASLVREVSR